MNTSSSECLLRYGDLNRQLPSTVILVSFSQPLSATNPVGMYRVFLACWWSSKKKIDRFCNKNLRIFSWVMENFKLWGYRVIRISNVVINWSCILCSFYRIILFDGNYFLKIARFFSFLETIFANAAGTSCRTDLKLHLRTRI